MSSSKEFHHLTDLGNAKRLVDLHGDKLRYVPAWGWLVWDGRRWVIDRTGAAKRAAKDAVRSIHVEAGQIENDTERKEVAAWAFKSESSGKIEAMLHEAESEKELVAEPEHFDQNPMLFNCLNGTVDLTTGELLPHDRTKLITKLAPVEYDPTAECAIWLKFLDTIMGNRADLVGFLQRAIGYSLTGLTIEQVLFLLWGTGRNGKTTLLEAVQAMLGDYAKASNFNTFLEKNGDGPRNDIAKLAGSRFVSAVEADAGKRLAESVIKQLTGGDTISARFLFKEDFEFKPAFKIFLAANHKPVIRGQDKGIWRRIRLIPFDVTIPEEDVDKKLPDKLRGELSGILAWAIEGCLNWQKDGLQEPEEVKAATDAYKDESDILKDFLVDCCTRGRNREAELAICYKVYTEWAEDMGERPLTKRQFIDSLTERGFVIRGGTGNKRMIFGMGLKESKIAN